MSLCFMNDSLKPCKSIALITKKNGRHDMFKGLVESLSLVRPKSLFTKRDFHI